MRNTPLRAPNKILLRGLTTNLHPGIQIQTRNRPRRATSCTACDGVPDAAASDCHVALKPRADLLLRHCRAAILDHVMEADKEFCLTCELSFLFRMLDDAKGSVCQVRRESSLSQHAGWFETLASQQRCSQACHGHHRCTLVCPICFAQVVGGSGPCLQASNLIRALRQNREAAALGLLEGQSQRSEGQQDIEVNVNKVHTSTT